jgi:hypothetical protein
LGSLNTQEVGVGVQSIWTAIEVRNVGGYRFFGAAVEVSLRKVDGVAEVHDLAQKVWAMAEAFQYAWHLLTARVRAPFVVNRCHFAGGIRVFYEVDLPKYFLTGDFFL